MNDKQDPIQVDSTCETTEKLEVIRILAKAQLELAKAIGGIHTTIEIHNCRFEAGEHPAIHIEQ